MIHNRRIFSATRAATERQAVTYSQMLYINVSVIGGDSLTVL